MTCPICQKPTSQTHKPFCSPRCADVDLGRWLAESYKLPSPTPLEDDEQSPPAD